MAVTLNGPIDRQRDQMCALLDLQRQAFIADGPPDVALRRNRIDRLLAVVLDNADDFVDAMAADFGTRPRTGSLFTEILGMISVIEHTRTHVPQWMRATKLMRAGRMFGLRAEVEPSPLGAVGIIGPWNFPLHLVVLPATAALAAGNRVMIKMSEITPRTAELLKTRAANYFDPAELHVVTGGADVAAAFAALPFDHLFFTGSPAVGALVQQAAAPNLVPVTLELGGKNPVVVSPDADITRSATRIAQGRMINGGQVCVGPDYVFVPADRADEFVGVVCDALRGMFPSIVSYADYCSSVNQANFDRVVGLIEDARAKGARIETVAPPGVALPDHRTRNRPDDRARCRRHHADRHRGDVRTGPHRASLPPTRRRRRLHQRPSGTPGGVLVRAGRNRLPILRAAHPQRWRRAQRLCRTDDSVCRTVRRGGPQRHGGLPWQGRFRCLQPPPHRSGQRPSVHHHRQGGAAVLAVDACDHRGGADGGAPSHSPSAQAPLMACSRAHR